MQASFEFKAFREADLDLCAEKFLAWAAGRRKFAFYGEMGAGKTTFIRAITRALSVTDNVSSPTFSLVNEYFSVPFGTIYHCDFYRLKNEREAREIGVPELFETEAWCFVEWPEKIHNLLPSNFVKVVIKEEHDYRLIEIH